MATNADNRGLRRLFRAFRNSCQGLAAAWRHETAFRQEIALTLVLVPLAIWLGDSGLERAVLILCWLLVVLAELVNSAIEAVVDRVGPEHHELSGRAKDIGSAVVLLALLNAALAWFLILIHFQ